MRPSDELLARSLDPRHWLTLDLVAHHLGFTGIRHVNRLIRAGKLKANIGPGRPRLVSVAALYDFLGLAPDILEPSGAQSGYSGTSRDLRPRSKEPDRTGR
jgi:hypothetical protein